MRNRDKDPEYERLIKSSKWRNVRICYLTEHPVCERCAAQNKTTIASEVHHIVPISRGKGYMQKRILAYNHDNLMALCHECHEQLHIEMGSSWYHTGQKWLGKEEIRKRAKEQASQFAATWLTK